MIAETRQDDGVIDKNNVYIGAEDTDTELEDNTDTGTELEHDTVYDNKEGTKFTKILLL